MGTAPIVPFINESLLADLNAQLKQELQGVEDVTPEVVKMLRMKYGIIEPQETSAWLEKE